MTVCDWDSLISVDFVYSLNVSDDRQSPKKISFVCESL